MSDKNQLHTDIWEVKNVKWSFMFHFVSLVLKLCDSATVARPEEAPYAGLPFEDTKIIGISNKDHHQIRAQYLEWKHSHQWIEESHWRNNADL